MQRRCSCQLEELYEISKLQKRVVTLYIDAPALKLSLFPSLYLPSPCPLYLSFSLSSILDAYVAITNKQKFV